MSLHTSLLSAGALLLAAIQPATAQSNFDHSHADFTALLSKHVEDGLVDYATLDKSPEQLLNYLKKLGAVEKSEFDSWNHEQRLAFLINLYNAETLELIIDGYPTKSIRELGGISLNPWGQPVVDLFGEKVSLDHVEKEIILPNYNEPRAHYALVCAAVGCPPLRAEAFDAARLDEQLDDQARVFLGQTAKNFVDDDGNLHLSPIFDWYGADFGSNSAEIAAHVKAYLPESAAAKLSDDPDISFTFYDWSLNEKGAVVAEEAPSGLQAWLLKNLQRIELLGPLREVAYVIGYIVCSLLFISGLLLTLAGGFLFGPFWGVVIVSFASNIAAASAFLIARYLLRGKIEKKFAKNPKFAAIDNAVAHEGWKIVLLTRLVPFLPFVALNYIYGLTKVRFWPYVFANFIGMLPGTIAYVWIGSFAKSLTELAAGGGGSHWSKTAFLVVGIVAAFAVSIYITKIARRALAEHVPEDEEAKPEAETAA